MIGLDLLCVYIRMSVCSCAQASPTPLLTAVKIPQNFRFCKKGGKTLNFASGSLFIRIGWPFPTWFMSTYLSIYFSLQRLMCAAVFCGTTNSPINGYSSLKRGFSLSPIFSTKTLLNTLRMQNIFLDPPLLYFPLYLSLFKQTRRGMQQRWNLAAAIIILGSLPDFTSFCFSSRLLNLKWHTLAR